MFYIYRHIRLDTNTPFYIGMASRYSKGNKSLDGYDRAYYKNNRTNSWKAIAKSAGYKVDIVMDLETEDMAIKKEMEFISLYGRSEKGGMLVNKTKGGKGILGYTVTEETKKRLSDINSGSLHPQYGKTHNKEWLNNQSKSKIGELNVASKKVRCIQNGVIYESQGEAALAIFGTREMSKKVSDICRGLRKQYKGYTFERVPM